MAELTIDEIRKYLDPLQGREVDIDKVRKDFGLTPDTKSWNHLRVILFRLAEQKIVKPSGRRDGIYRVVQQVEPIQVFGKPRERKPPFTLMFPRDFDTGMELPFAEHVVVREGDCILIAGESNWGKTTIALQFSGENIDQHPVLMGNEYSKDKEPTPRFLNRLDDMDWIEWTNGDGMDKFTLLPVKADYAEHIIKDRINIVDWVNIDTGEHYMIGKVMEDMKSAVGKGVVIIVIQKAATADAGRGGQFTKDFADLELLIDKHSDFESRMTIGKVKEYTTAITGRSWAYEIAKGVKLHNVREVIKCPTCHGFKYIKGQGACSNCHAIGWINR